MESRETVLTHLFGMGWPAPHRVIWNEATGALARPRRARAGLALAPCSARPGRSSRGCRWAPQARPAASQTAGAAVLRAVRPDRRRAAEPARRGRALRRRVGRADPRHPARRRAGARPGAARREAPGRPGGRRRGGRPRDRDRRRGACCATTGRRRRPSRRRARRSRARRRTTPRRSSRSRTRTARTREFLERGSRGMAHIVYALSPGGVEASVARTTRWRRAVERAVAGHPAGRRRRRGDAVPRERGAADGDGGRDAGERDGADADHPLDGRLAARHARGPGAQPRDQPGAAARAAAGRARGEGEEAARRAAARAPPAARAEGRRRALRPAEVARRGGPLPARGAPPLRARRPRDRLVPHGHRQPEDASSTRTCRRARARAARA